MLEILPIPDQMIVIFLLPKSSLQPEELVRFLRGERFPRMKNFIQLMPVRWPDHRVDVVGHDRPSKQIVAATVEVLQGTLDDGCDLRIFQVAGAFASVEGILHDGFMKI